MPAQGDYDPTVIASRLGDWLAGMVDGPCRVLAVDAPSTSGFSSETLLVDAEWGDERHDLVVRSRPSGHTVFPEYDLDKQVRCLRVVAERSDVPVPRVLWSEPSTSVLGEPFYVMDRVDGLVPPDNPPFTLGGWLHDADPGDQRRLFDHGIDVLAGLHRIDPEAFDFLGASRHGPPGLAEQLAYGESFLEWAAAGRPQPVAEAALARLKATFPSAPPPTGLNWGDARIGNIIWRDFAPVAVLDWEMATLGPGECDLAWFLYMNHFFDDGLKTPPLPGFPDDATAIARYEDAVGRGVDDLDWYLVWAGFRYVVVMIRLAQRMAMEGSDMAMPEDDNLVTQMLERYL